MATLDPFALNLSQQTAVLLHGLNILAPSTQHTDNGPSTPPLPPTPTSSPYDFLPLSHLLPLYELAYGPTASSAGACSPEQIVDVLSDLLEVGPLTMRVAHAFRPLLMVLMARWIDRVRGGKDEWVRRVVAGSLLAEGVEEVWPILLHLISTSPYTLLPSDSLAASVQTLHPLLLTHLRILALASPSLPPPQFLSLTIVRSLFTTPHPDPSTRLLAIRVYALATHVAERKRREWEETCLDGAKFGQGALRWFEGMVAQTGEGAGAAEELELVESWSDAWVWPVLEQKRLDGFYSWTAGIEDLYTPSDFILPSTSLPSHLVLVASRILLFRIPPSASSPTSSPSSAPIHISTPTSTVTLLSLSLALSTHSPILLTSPPSSGKTHLITHLSHTLFPQAQNHILTISLADTSLDPKSLLGNYVSSPTDPGKFVWVQGALAKAVREGRWVVLEDIDKAGGEVLALVGGLAEGMGRSTRRVGDRGSLKVPGREDVPMGEGFSLFATRTVTPYASSSTATEPKPLEFPKPVFLNSQKFEEVFLPPPSKEEIKMILQARFGTLVAASGGADGVGGLMKAWEVAGKVGSMAGGGSTAKGREVGLRDLIKWFGRVESLVVAAGAQQIFSSVDGTIVNPVIQEEIFIEACDVFFGSLPKVSAAIALAVGNELGLNDERTLWCLERRRPELVLVGGEDGGEVKAVRIGRGKLKCKKTKQAYHNPATERPFALTRPSLLLLEQISVATSHLEPVLLVGETGTGKTTAVSHLSSLLRRPLISLNLSTQTESSDLLGGFKPLDPKIPAGELLVRFGDLFGRTFSRKKNKRFEDVIRKAVGGGKWSRCVEMWGEAGRLAVSRLKSRKEGKPDGEEDKEEPTATADARDADPESASTSTAPRKRRKMATEAELAEIDAMLAEWDAFTAEVADFDVRHVRAGGRFVFSFVEGPLVRALRKGDWVLLDEVNLASPETLESLASVLESSTASVVLTERGDLEPVVRHPDFRLFACMNPATDVGKKDLPPSLRSRFTELYVPSPDSDREALLAIVNQYIGDVAVADRPAILDVAELYFATKSLAEARELADGANHPPHYSMRTLARALTFAADVTPIYGLRRSLWEGFLMSFTMLLDVKSAAIVRALAEKHILGGARNPRAILAQMPGMPAGKTEDDLVRFGPFWLQRGPKEVDEGSDYVLTPSVQAKLVDLARVISSNRFPVLIQGPTSSGKTSAVEYLARRTGHRFVRINNHEHTDIQEYLGTYVSDPDTGKLVFQEGVLVRAVRRGDWIVLDELNLAPTDVLEALNRLLDDNRELVIPETQEVIRPHPHFMLFATQNPPGLYGGRKVLSRAFRNRFLEVHFDDVPQAELETILCQRCRIAPSFAKRIVSVFQELQHRRQAGRVFETKQSFATLRDLFRWAGRDAIDVQTLAENGYMLLAERARRADDKVVVKEVLEKVLKVQIDEKKLYDLSATASEDILLRLGCPLPPASSSASVVWTSAMQRLYTLVASALRYNEPVLLVGETGCGKTSVCQLLSDALGSQLIAVNCHQNMETADLLGGQKPLRNRAARQLALFEELRLVLDGMGIAFEIPADADTEQTVLAAESLVKASDPAPSKESVQAFRDVVSGIKRAGALFEWHDGPLIQAMQSGDLVLLDEVSLADDSVLERLNSVLEPARTLVLAEKGGRDVEQMTIVASQGFQVLATMNPGGDYGKKELSPALRNRFTEIWVPSLDDHDDLIKIIRSSWASESLDVYSEPLLRFLRWFAAELGDSSTAVIGVRDILSWVQFSNISVQRLGMTPQDVFRHAAHMVVIDGLGSLPQCAGLSSASLLALKNDCVAKLDEILGSSSTPTPRQGISDLSESFSIDGFGVQKGEVTDIRSDFSLRAPTTCDNAMRVLRGCQLPKPILLEGSPGVGKTSLITALAAVTQNELCRINLSDQTDLADLFGSDLPVEGGKPGEFAWKDAAFLTALQSGQWVLLDEMNLASQAVLEGLNAVLDHRGTVYLPELGRSFSRHPNFRIFAAQNPVGQGGGRKGLPKSFLNRFTRVYVQELSPEDLRLICGHLYPNYDAAILEKMIEFNSRLHVETMVKRTFGRDGSPWEFNLRDVLRWLALVHSSSGLEQRAGKPVEHLRTIYLHRFRSATDRQRVLELFEQVFAESVPQADRPWPAFSPDYAQFGHSLLDRSPDSEPSPSRLSVLHAHLSPLEAIAKCINLGWLIIVAGPSSSGKTSMLRLLAQLSGRRLREFSMNSGVDTMELLGSFEQADSRRRMGRITVRLSALARKGLSTAVFDEARWASVTSHAEVLSSLSTSDDVDSFIRAGTAVVADLASILGDLDEAELNWVRAALADLASAGATSGRFEWVDGELVQAVTAGDWLVIENANLCNASVLDRINSLCETNGSLVLSERGTVDGVPQLLLPHPKFRLFMTLDPRHGELSRAMRNRGVEISLDAISSSVDLDRIASLSRVGPKPEVGSASLPAQLGRRAISSTPLAPSPTSSTWDSLIIQDSILSSILPHGPAIDPSAAPSELASVQHSADMSHLLESLSPIAFNVLTHLASLYQQPSDVPLAEVFDATSRALVDSGVIDVVSSLKASFAETRSLSPVFLDSQPIDPLMNPYLFAPEDTRHALASEMVELVVRNALSRTRTNAALKSASRKRVVDLTVLEKSFLVANGRKLQAVLDSAAQSIYPLMTAFYQTVELSVRFAISVNNAQEAESLLRLLSQLSDVMSQLEAASDSVDFNYSAVQVIGQWLIDLASNIPAEAVVALQAQLTVLQNSISTDSGGGQREIWLSSLPRTSQQAFFDLEKRLVHLVAEASQSHKDFQHLRVSAFNVAATSSLGLEDSRAGLETLGREIEEALRNIAFAQSLEYEAKTPLPPATSLIAVAELDVLSVLFSDPESTVHLDLQEVVKAAQSMPSFPLFDMVAVQHAIWSLDAGAALDSTVRKDLIKSWLRVVWTKSSNETLTGAADLFRPVVLTELLQKSDQAASKLHDILELDIALGRVGTVLGVRSRLATVTRQTSTTQVLIRMILDLCHAFESTYETRVLSQLESQAQQNVLAELDSFIAGLESTSHDYLATSLKTHVSPALRHLATKPRDTPASMEALGRAWVALSLAFLSLYVPNVPIDPAVAQQSQLALLESQDQRLTAQAVALRRSEAEITGNASNPRIKLNEDRLAVVQGSISQLGPLIVERETNVSLLTTMFKEIHHFLYQVVDPARLQELMDLLARSSDSQAFLREQSAQDNIVGFLQRIKETYGLFSDLTQPIDLALSQLRTGLRFLSRAAELESALDKGRSESELVSILVQFPTAFSIDRLHAAELPVRLKSEAPAVATSKLLILEAQAIGYDVAIGLRLDDRTVRSVGVIFDQLSHLWLMDREKEAQAKQEAESLYRQRKDEEEILSDLELEEKEFKELFPQFGDIMDEDEDTHTANHATGKSTAFVRPEQASELYKLHASLFSSTFDVDQKETYLAQRSDVIRDVFDGPYDALTDSLDEQLAFQIDLLAKETARISSAPNPNGRPYDFYSDGNPNEMRKAVHLVGRLVRRLESLSEEWPEQMVLRHLNDRCQAILSMTLNSSIVKVIAAFEGLLLHTADWEAYANRDNTLKSFQADIGDLIVSWRRLELSCWASLLETQAVAFADGAAVWWFRLYEVLVQGARSAVIEDEQTGTTTAAENHAAGIVSLLDQFVSSSPLGQYSSRLRLLKSFSRYLALLAETSTTFPGLDRISRILGSLGERYTLVEPKVAASLQTQRAKVESSIRDFIKLASWKDVNVHALKASAQHTHRQLHRCIRKFREILRQPCLPLLGAPEGDNGPSENGFSSAADQVATSTSFTTETFPSGPQGSIVSSAAHLVNLPSTFGKFQQLLASSIRPSLAMTEAEAVNDLAVEIITTSKALADETPGSVTEETLKILKGLLTRKRRALGDLLKELKRIGLSNNVRPDVLARQTSLARLHSHNLLVRPSTLQSSAIASIDRIESYHFRLLITMPGLRDSLREHHPDLLTRELQRTLGFVESTLSVALDNRIRLSTGLQQFDTLRKVVDRLEVAGQASSKAIALVGDSFDEPLHQAHQLMCRVADALQETLDARISYGHVVTKNSSSSNASAHLSSLSSQAVELRDGLASIPAKDKKTVPILMDDELDALRSCHAFVASGIDTFRQLSKSEPHFRHLYEQILLVLQSTTVTIPAQSASDRAADVLLWQKSDRIVNSLLVVAQELRSMPAPKAAVVVDDENADLEETPDKYLVDGSASLGKTLQLLRLPDLVSQLEDLFHKSSASVAVSQTVVHRITPFLAEYALAVESHLVASSSWTGSIYKLAFILSATTASLAAKGFCTPQEAGDTQSGEGEGGKTQDGTGMGEGSGAENVSEQIEDESQVEGLQGENEEPQPKDQKKQEGGAIEMSEDFGGELEDVSADGSDEEEDDEGDDGEEESPPDEQIGDVDPLDENAVDEKLWGDEKGDESDKKDEKLDQDHSTEQTQESEMVAKENETPDQKPKEKPEADPQGNEEQPNEDENGEEEQEMDDPEGEEEPRGQGEKMPDHVPEADTLDLPDELDLGGDDDKSDEGGGDDMPEDPLDDEQPVAEDGPSHKQKSPEPDEFPEQQDGDNAPEPTLPEPSAEDDPTADPEETDATDPAQAEAGEDDFDMDEEPEPELNVAKPKVESGTDKSDAASAPEEVGIETGQEEAPTEQEDGTKDESGKQAEASTADRQQDEGGDNTQDDSPSEPPPNASESRGGAGETVPMENAPEDDAQPPPKTQDTNPLRNLGDALKEIRRRFEQIEDAPEDTEETQNEPAQDKDGDSSMQPAEVEYAKDDDDEDMQALGPAPDDQVQDLTDLRIADDEKESNEVAQEMEIDDDLALAPEQTMDLQAPEQDLTAEKALTETQLRQRGFQQDPKLEKEPPQQIEEEEPAPLTEDEAKALNEEVEIKTKEWINSDRSSSSAEDIWRLYTSLTHDLSHSLCEQLRLILEPTLATRLKGDYRTGKRLNMKKIVPYVASEFTKDKIWLRRTRPSSREYQVLVSLDDSKSMAESHSVHLAYETLALVSQALTKLEVGDLGIASFGSDMEMVHPLDGTTFSDQTGANVLSRFKFDQKATNVLLLVEKTLAVLAEARQRRASTSSTSSDLWQLQIILSDGICQNHEELRTLLRKAAEQRVMIVFILIDSLHRSTQPSGMAGAAAEPAAHQRNSILSMQSAKYEANAKGQMELVMERYLDTFPFETYVVLRDVSALPEVLSGVLRQWMERIAEQ